MIKIINVLILIFFATSAFAKQEPYPGQFVYGNIGPYGLDTEILLPPGEWIVAGVSTSNGGIRWAEIILLQTESKKIKALLNIKYPRKLEERIGKSSGGNHKEGWRRDKHFDNNTCDDYDRQNSNYHETLIKKRRTAMNSSKKTKKLSLMKKLRHYSQEQGVLHASFAGLGRKAPGIW